jgi:hypothetical protein
VALTPTIVLQILPFPENPDLPHFIFLGSHILQAKDFIEYRPDTLHRRLLSQHLLSIIAQATDPIPVSTLYTLSPHSSPFQIQRSLKDLLNMGQIERPARGFYTLAPTNPTFSFNGTAATTPNPLPANILNGSAATTLNTVPANILNGTAATTLNIQPANGLNSTATTTSPPEPAGTLTSTSVPELALT